MVLWDELLRESEVSWRDDVVFIAVLAERAGIGGDLHDNVIGHYFEGVRAVPRRQDARYIPRKRAWYMPRTRRAWHMPTIREGLRRIAAASKDEAVTGLARATLKKLP